MVIGMDPPFSFVKIDTIVSTVCVNVHVNVQQPPPPASYNPASCLQPSFIERGVMHNASERH